MSELLTESQLREQDYRLYGPEVAQARAEKRQRDWIEGELRKKNLPPVTDPQSYSRNDARKGSAGVNLKDWRNYL